MTSSFVCATLNLGRKKSTGTEPNIKRDSFSDVYIILSRDLINNIDHMSILGTEP